MKKAMQNKNFITPPPTSPTNHIFMSKTVTEFEDKDFHVWRGIDLNKTIKKIT